MDIRSPGSKAEKLHLEIMVKSILGPSVLLEAKTNMTNGNTEKNPAAVALGRTGGLKKLEKYGVEEFKRMADKATIARKLKKKNVKCDLTIARRCPKNGLKYLPNGKCPCYE